MSSRFSPLPEKPDHPALERGILDWWAEERIFEELREQNRGGERFSFVDGPITANNPMGAHHCWGRTLKDVFQRYKALRGFDQRYQNGFDCQGLWVEVGVERSLGLNSKREIEEYGLTAQGDWWAVERFPEAGFVRRVRGEELVGLEYEGPFDALPAQQGVVHRVIPWEEVTLEEGTGIVHIAPGCGAEDFELAR